MTGILLSGVFTRAHLFAELRLCAFCVVARGLERGDSGLVNVTTHALACDLDGDCSCCAGPCDDCRADVAALETWRREP